MIMYSLRENKLGDSGVKILCVGVTNLKCNDLITLEYTEPFIQSDSDIILLF